ncbi:MAG: radical SAM protein, partial [Coriobacteriales bacterium]|nr:radical SAM protein [Coriobacteriales bacterium]
MSTGSTGGTVCKVCPHACRLEPGERGVCGVRVVQDGQVRSTNYALSTALALDPIEKKPLARFYPGSLVLSIGGFGCNLDCPFCQNWQIARGIPDYAGEKPDEKRADESAGAVNKLRTTAARIVETQAIETRTAEDRTKAQATRARAYPLHARYIVPEELVAQALVLRERGNIGIAFTYNEPLVSYEYVRDTAILAHDAGLKTVLVTNGYANPGTLAEVFAHIDAANIDLKAFNQDFYDLVGAPR